MENSTYVDRHSRQLILPGWSLELQEKISSVKIAVPNDAILCMYLIALGIENFYFYEDSNFYLNIPNWESHFKCHKLEDNYNFVICDNDSFNKINYSDGKLVLNQSENNFRIKYINKINTKREYLFQDKVYINRDIQSLIVANVLSNILLES